MGMIRKDTFTVNSGPQLYCMHTILYSTRVEYAYAYKQDFACTSPLPRCSRTEHFMHVRVLRILNMGMDYGTENTHTHTEDEDKVFLLHVHAAF